MTEPKKPARKQDPDMSRRKEQLARVEEASEHCERRAARNRRDREQKSILLDSVVDGLQQEVDKLLKKSPVDAVSDLMLQEVNQVIRDVRLLLAHDEYVARQREFVAAGENPEIRDVSLALTQLKRGLQRYRKGREELDAADKALVREAQTIRSALDMYVHDGRKQIRSEEIHQALGGVAKAWINSRGHFDFDKLDATNLDAYFQLDV